jgi:hypothetical protein
MKAQLHRAWLARMQPRPRFAEFPVSVLALFTGVLVLVGALAGVSFWSGGGRAINAVALTPFGTLVLVNLLCLPLAGLVIVLRRRYVRTCEA